MKIIPYFGNVYIDQFKRDTKEIRDHGFDTILHPVTETDLQFHEGNVRDLIRVTKEEGFSCWVDPHCVGNDFGYGNLSVIAHHPSTQVRSRDSQHTIERACPNSTVFRETMDRFLTLTQDSDYVLWDEPYLGRCWCDRCNGRVPMLDFLQDTTSSIIQKSSVAFWGGSIRSETFPVSYLMDDVGVSITPDSIYDTSHTNMWYRHINSVSSGTTSVWFPGYNIKSGHEQYIIGAVQIAYDHGLDHIASWGFRGCEGWSYARCERPMAMWESIGQAFRNLL